ncbi:MAG: SRPBCC family protein [Vicinamibacterales bacterium]
MKYSASTSINAPASVVWKILLDTARWPEWDPSCDHIEGSVAEGSTVKAFTKLSPGRAFPVKVTELVPDRRMTWTGGMPLGLFKGVRTFTLEPQPEGGTEFSLREEFSGPMLALIGRSIPDMTVPFRQFVAGLKARSESAHANPSGGK